ncbi:zinc-ribbon domain containing protein [Occallatibacter savannae]|uniref:zinc-ribbon domain containing protein n=1 Tax=Occallatibacter savannae TaxID=1002691 RepID=UPI000D694D71
MVSEQEQLKNVEVECRACGSSFVFSKEEQEFYRMKGFTHVPKTCPSCRSKHRQKPIRTDWHVMCADCGEKTTIPFVPTKKQAVYCWACFTKRRSPPA